MDVDEVWREIGWLFDTDDGSLPEVSLNDLPLRATQQVFDVLASRSSEIRGEFWHIAEAKSFKVREHLNAPTLVEEGIVEVFHVVFCDVRNLGQRMPDLGAFFFQDSVALDYRMGIEWNAVVLDAFLDLLRELTSPFPDVLIEIEYGTPSENEQFNRVLAARSTRT